jgi:hypothetical protein
MSRTRDKSRRATLVAGVRTFIRAVQEEDEVILQGLLRLSERRRIFAPLAFTVGAFALLIDGLKVLLANWRLMLIQVLPALWIWLAMMDLKLHVLHGHSFKQIHGPILIPIFLVIMAITTASFFLNAVFAFAIAGPRPPVIRPAFTEARRHLKQIAMYGCVVGSMLAVATTVAPRWDKPWFSLTLGAVVGLMMIIYVAVPARMIGVEAVPSKRDKLTASLLSGVLGATVSAPPYVIGRIGILMLGSSALLIPGIFVLAIGLTLQAGATGAVRAIKMSTRLAVGARAEPEQEAGREPGVAG